MKLREVVAKNLRRLRNAQGLSQEELADRADVNRNYVGMLEREEHAATIDMLEKLATCWASIPSSSSNAGKTRVSFADGPASDTGKAQ